MNSNDYIETIIQQINEKIDLIEEHLCTINSVVPYFKMMGDYFESLNSIYDNFYADFVYVLFKLKKLNLIVMDEFINDYEVISNKLSKDCFNVLEEFISINENMTISKFDQ